MLHPARQATFRRTIQRKRKPVQLVFNPGEPVEVSAKEVVQLQKDLGHGIVPVEFDERDKPRAIFDEVTAVDDLPVDDVADVPEPVTTIEDVRRDLET